MLLHGDCLEQLHKIKDEEIDSLITDPPAGISFMGKSWDSNKGGRDEWIKWMASVMRECHRVLKPGAHGLVWAIPRTSHWTATALEDAGFEVRDVVTHLFGSGFPKSHNLEKSTDGIAKGQGTALKPASEHWILIRKPCSEKTVAANVLKHGTGGLNIDASRISAGDEKIASPLKCSTNKHEGYKRPWNDDPEARARADAQKVIAGEKAQKIGRFPANLVFSHTTHCTEEMCDIECAVKALDGQSGVTKSSSQIRNNKPSANKAMSGANMGHLSHGHSDSGGASRFFYCAKISTSERNSAGPNGHPTIKTKKLMAYLIKLITPPGGIVLDPFMGSGSTGIAAKEGGFDFIGIERDEEYFEIAKARIK